MKLFDKIKKEKRKNTQIQRNYFPHTLSDKFQQIVQKICNTFSFLSLFFAFLLRKIPFDANKTEHTCFNQTGVISTLDGTSLKLGDNFTYLGNIVSSTEKDIDTQLTKVWTAIDKLSIIWKSDLTDKMKQSFFQAAVVSILLYGCTTWTLIKRLEKKLDGNYTWMLRAILNKSWRQHPTKHQLYGHQPPITKIIQVRRTRHAGHCWRIRDELISDVLLWTSSYGRAKAGRPARTYIQQLCENTGCSPEDLPEARTKGRSSERGSGISVLAARHDDDDDDCLCYLFECVSKLESCGTYCLNLLFDLPLMEH